VQRTPSQEWSGYGREHKRIWPTLLAAAAEAAVFAAARKWGHVSAYVTSIILPRLSGCYEPLSLRPSRTSRRVRRRAWGEEDVVRNPMEANPLAQEILGKSF
jgi:hypothetical protein